MDPGLSTLILDNGSGYMKCGFSNQNIPLYTIPALVGRPMLRYGENIGGVEMKPLMIGDEVLPVRSLLELSHPIKEGIIENKDDMSSLWKYCIHQKLNVNESDTPGMKVLLTEAPMNPIKNKETMAEILFEDMEFAAFNIEPQAKLSLISEGCQHGIVLDSGDGVTHCIPIFDNTILHHQIRRLNIAGRHITDYLIKLLQLKGYAFNSSADFETVREIKEKFAFVSCDIKGDRKLNRETTYYKSQYKLPDQSMVNIDSERFEAAEILFNPSLINSECDSVPELIFNCINSCPMDTRRSLYNAVVLSGASTMFPGFSSRLESDLKSIYREKITKGGEVKVPINIIDTPSRRYSVFIGACFLANHYNNGNNESYWITRDEWLESGKQIIDTKCPNVMRY